MTVQDDVARLTAIAEAAAADAANAKLQSRVLAGVLIADLAGRLSKRFDTFATWLLAGCLPASLQI
jgi:hypothetical protein